MSGSDPIKQDNDLPKLSLKAATELLFQGKSQIQAGQFADAKGLLERLLKVYPNHSEALYCISVAQRLSENYSGALNSLQKLIRIEPS